MECASAVLVLENAMPAFKAASAMRPRSSRLPSSRIRRGSTSRMSFTAEIANASEIGLALTFQIDSSACDKASSPLCSVTAGGSESISSGSMRAALGQVCGRCSEYFFWLSRSQMVAQGVTSLPVPAVVGTAIKALTACGVKAAPVASRPISSWKRPLAVPTMRALAVSMALPPPTATMTSTSAWSRQKVS
jgi:hypothetical protein